MSNREQIGRWTGPGALKHRTNSTPMLHTDSEATINVEFGARAALDSLDLGCIRGRQVEIASRSL